jgi:ribosomal protein L31E
MLNKIDSKIVESLTSLGYNVDPPLKNISDLRDVPAPVALVKYGTELPDTRSTAQYFTQTIPVEIQVYPECDWSNLKEKAFEQVTLIKKWLQDFDDLEDTVIDQEYLGFEIIETGVEHMPGGISVFIGIVYRQRRDDPSRC